ncbi:unnamed protein product [Closterium sp. NIES-54]
MLTVAFAIVALSTVTESASYGDTGRATATFYGSGDGGNCGYGVLAESGYGPLIAAGSAPLYKGGKGCGACYKVRCVDSKWCKDAEITVPITDFCPGGGVCCATCTHFDLSQPAFGIIADPVAGVIPLAYQRVPCSFPTSITFRVTGTNYWMNVLLLRVGGPGEVALVEVSSKNDPNWRPLTHDWGTNWVSWTYIEGPLKFRLTSGMDGAVITTGENCVPAIYPGDYTCGAQFTSGYNSSDTNGDGGSNSSVGNSTDVPEKKNGDNGSSGNATNGDNGNSNSASSNSSSAAPSPSVVPPATIPPGTTPPVTTDPGTNPPATTGPATTAPGTTAPGTTAPATTPPVTTAPATTPRVEGSSFGRSSTADGGPATGTPNADVSPAASASSPAPAGRKINAGGSSAGSQNGQGSQGSQGSSSSGSSGSSNDPTIPSTLIPPQTGEDVPLASQTTGGVTIPNASYSIDSNGGAATSSNAQVGAGGTAAAGAVGAGNPVTAGTVKRGKKWRTGVAPAKKAGGGHPVGKGHRAPGQGHHVKGQPVLAR